MDETYRVANTPCLCLKLVVPSLLVLFTHEMEKNRYVDIYYCAVLSRHVLQRERRKSLVNY